MNCTCETVTLMNHGCQCGAVEAKRAVEEERVIEEAVQEVDKIVKEELGHMEYLSHSVIGYSRIPAAVPINEDRKFTLVLNDQYGGVIEFKGYITHIGPEDVTIAVIEPATHYPKGK